MNKDQEVEFYKKFSSVLRAKITNNQISFPDGTQFEFEPILAYRGILRNKNDNTPVNSNDMLSHYERKLVPRGIPNYENDAKYYAVSLFETIDMLKECWKFPRPNTKIAQGYIYKEGGPQYTDLKKHISWWLYENIDFNGFIIRDDLNE